MSQKKIKSLTQRLLAKKRKRQRMAHENKKWAKLCEFIARMKRRKEKTNDGYQPRIVKRKKKK